MRGPAIGLKRLAKALGYHIGRRPNRFDAMEEALCSLRDRAFEPDLIVDAGANVGEWSLMASAIFPTARLHLIEPQPGCHPVLSKLSAARSWQLHPVALAPPGVSTVTMCGTAPDSTSSGAWVNPAGDGDLVLPASTLDQLLAEPIRASRRSLLKLDLEGYELPVLRGATACLGSVEVLVTEVSFYDVHHNGRTVFDELFVFLKEHGYTFYDLAKLAARPRDDRPSLGDVVFVRHDSELLTDVSWH